MPSDQQTAARACDLIALAVLGAVTLIALLTFRDYGLSWDDYAHAEYGELLLSFYTSGFADQRALSFVNLYYYGGGFDLLAAALAKVLPFRVFETRRLLGAAVGILGLFATWRIGRRIGGPLAGLLALVLLGSLPAVLRAHVHEPEGFAVRGRDGDPAARAGARVRSSIRGRRPAPVRSPGVGFGLSFGSRIMGAFGAIAALAAFALIVAVEARRTASGRPPRGLDGSSLALMPRVAARLCGDGAGVAMGE